MYVLRTRKEIGEVAETRKLSGKKVGIGLGIARVKLCPYSRLG